MHSYHVSLHLPALSFICVQTLKLVKLYQTAQQRMVDIFNLRLYLFYSVRNRKYLITCCALICFILQLTKSLTAEEKPTVRINSCNLSYYCDVTCSHLRDPLSVLSSSYFPGIHNFQKHKAKLKKA